MEEAGLLFVATTYGHRMSLVHTELAILDEVDIKKDNSKCNCSVFSRTDNLLVILIDAVVAAEQDDFSSRAAIGLFTYIVGHSDTAMNAVSQANTSYSISMHKDGITSEQIKLSREMRMREDQRLGDGWFGHWSSGNFKFE
jgi:hypothetical protein